MKTGGDRREVRDGIRREARAGGEPTRAAVSPGSWAKAPPGSRLRLRKRARTLVGAPASPAENPDALDRERRLARAPGDLSSCKLELGGLSSSNLALRRKGHRG